ncbi:MAG TPA: thioredoxin fold domain-containing protein [Pseudomonadales bacterium]
MKMLLRSSLAILVVVAASTVLGADARPAVAPVTQNTIDAVVAKLKALRPELQIEGATAAQIPGMVTIELSGGALLYSTADGRYLIAGDLYEVGDSLVNLAEKARDAKRKELIAGVPVTDMAVFPARGNRKAVITVFTDVDCSYCRKLHLEVPRMNQMGVEVRYMAYPRTGLDSPGYAKMVTAWCSSNRGDAITRMKRGEELPPKTCNNPVAKEYEIGHQVGLTGTPAIVLEDGRLLAGYVSADELGEVLGI